MAIIKARVIPNAKKDIVEVDGDSYTIRVAAPPDKGKANKAALKLLSKHFGKRVFLVFGARSRDKVFEVE